MMVHSLCHRKKSGTNLLLRPRRNQKTMLLWRKFIVLTSHRDAPISTKTFTECTERYLTYKYINELFSESYLLYLRSVSSHKGAKIYLNSENIDIFYASDFLKILRKIFWCDIKQNNLMRLEFDFDSIVVGTYALSFNGSKMILYRPNYFGQVPIVNHRSNLYWSGPNYKD